MYYDYYYPPLPENKYPTADTEFQADLDTSEEPMSSQEYDPIIPLDDTPYENPASKSGPYQPVIPLPDRPVAPLPDRPAVPLPDRPAVPLPDRPAVPLPDRPTIPLPDRPGRPIPDRPPYRPIPGRPSRPDLSWNWGFLLPNTIFPVSIARVRFYNSAVREPIRIYINNRLIASGLNYMSYTKFYNVAPGRYRVTIYRNSNLRTPIIDIWMTFNRNTSSNVTISGLGKQYWLEVN